MNPKVISRNGKSTRTCTIAPRRLMHTRKHCSTTITGLILGHLGETTSGSVGGSNPYRRFSQAYQCVRLFLHSLLGPIPWSTRGGTRPHSCCVRVLRVSATRNLILGACFMTRVSHFGLAALYHACFFGSVSSASLLRLRFFGFTLTVVYRRHIIQSLY